jgi:hypothetical protein
VTIGWAIHSLNIDEVFGKRVFQNFGKNQNFGLNVEKQGNWLYASPSVTGRRYARQEKEAFAS